MKKNKKRCIVCGEPSKKILDWGFDTYLPLYKEEVALPYPKDATSHNYEIMKCESCSLVFSDPPLPGNGAFYGWVTQADQYYRAFRWEWGVVLEYLKKHPGASLLEIGCGTGNFLQYAVDNSDTSVAGLDTHAPSVDACVKRGLDVKCLDLGDFVTEASNKKYDIVCTFHCLEHVSDPLDTIRNIKKVLKETGILIITVPYSPTSLDIPVSDCMNLPPHHLTQWNAKSLRALAEKSGLKVSISTDTGIFTTSSIFKTAYWLYLERIKSGAHLSTKVNSVGHLSKLKVLFECLYFALTRDKVSGKPAGDIALAIFTLTAST